MNSFKTNFPVLTMLFALIGTEAQLLSAGNESWLQKLESEGALIPQLIPFMAQSGSLSAEIAKVKASPADIEAGVETLVTDFAFSSDKAKSIVESAFTFGEGLVAQIAPISALIKSGEALIAAIKA